MSSLARTALILAGLALALPGFGAIVFMLAMAWGPAFWIELRDVAPVFLLCGLVGAGGIWLLTLGLGRRQPV